MMKYHVSNTSNAVDFPQMEAGSYMNSSGGYNLGSQEEYEKFAKARNKSLKQARVKELALEAKLHMISEPRMLQFYELIVKELIAKVEVLEQDSRNHISYALKKEFGVEDAR